MKIILIHLADAIDNYIIRHRSYWVCNKINNSKWWGEKDCRCLYCRKFGSDAE